MIQTTKWHKLYLLQKVQIAVLSHWNNIVDEINESPTLGTLHNSLASSIVGLPDNTPEIPNSIENDLYPTTSTLNNNLANWITSENIPRNPGDKLLKFLTDSGVEGLPKSTQPLLNTPGSNIIPSPIFTGEYFHYGIQT